MIEDALQHDIKKARDLYIKASNEYRKLSYIEKKEIYDDFVGMYNKLLKHFK